MPVIDSALVQNITDSIAARVQDIDGGFVDAASGLGFYVRIHDHLNDKFGDPDVEGDLVVPANELDLDYQSGTSLSGVFGDFVRQLQAHVQTVGNFNDLDAYLTSQPLNVHEDFQRAYEATFGRKLKAINVFRETQIDMATVDSTSSGVCTFTDGAVIGVGSGDFDGASNSAASALVAVVTGGVIGATDLLLKVVGTNEAGTEIISDQLTIPSTTADLTEFNIVVAGTPGYLDVTSVQCAGGTSGDQVTVRQRVERTPLQ